MAIDPNNKFLYFNKDSTSTEMDEALCFPVSSFIGLEIHTSSRLHFFFEGSKGTDATVVRVAHEQYAFQKNFITSLVDEINYGENAFIRVYDHAERLTHPSDITVNMITDVVPTFYTQDTDFKVSGANLTFDSVQLTGIQTSAETFVNDDVSLMTSAAIEDKILSYGYSTASGDMTGVSISVGTGLDISQSNTTGGDYSATVSLDLTEVGVSGSANQLLTDDGDGTVTSEASLTYDSETLTIGNDDEGTAHIKRRAHSDGLGGQFRITGGNATAGQTDTLGGAIRVFAGQGTGTGAGGHIELNTYPPAASTGTSLNTSPHTWDFSDDGNLTVPGDIIGPTDGDLNIKSDGGVFFTLDTDTDESNQMFTIDETSSDARFEYNSTKADLNLVSGSDIYPRITLQAEFDGANGSSFTFNKRRYDTSTQVGEDNDVIGEVFYKSYNDNGTPELITYAKTQATIADASDSDEAGKYEIKVTTSDGSTSGVQNAFSAVGSPSANDVDVTLGHGSTSITTIAGGLADGTLCHGRLELGHASDTTFSRVSAGVADIQGKQIITAGAINVASGSQAPIGMQIARRTITTAEANAMNSTPIELVPAQGANTIIEISNVIARADRAATQTNSALTMDLHYADKEPGTYGAASLAHFRRFMYNKTTDIVERRPQNSTTSAVTLTEDVNKAVEVSFSSAATTNCFTSLDMYVTYFVIDIS